MAHPNRLHNTSLLIFGGTSGIGLGIASMALSNGAYVTISGSTPAKVAAKVAELQSLYPTLPPEHVRGYACDLADTENLEDNLREVFEKVTEGGERKVDHVAFTAGDAVKLPKLAEVRVEDVLAGFKVRLLSAVMIGKLLSTGRYMPASPRSSLTLTSGTNTLKPLPGWAVGAAWGAAIEGLGRGLAVDMKPIRVNVVAPGAIDTPLLQKFKAGVGEEVEKRFREEGSLMGVWGSVQDEAEAYGWFMRDWFVTGALAESNGGRMLV
ncbi:NAD(P)-binding protein [Lentithecium fluviatile CBS 122367]|uniref:NAD(P)-binding protein n=1 Tax=Lentithecium fluviatile CBS 122367 TaxID=1168545 RepID=A0A6G1IMD3_9PLEO|nr:NAD(P)-binding protein [Lentithecium fluviatile CBS 122367]